MLEMNLSRVRRISQTASVCRARRGSIPLSASEGVAQCPNVTFCHLSADVADFLPSLPARGEAPRVRVRVPLGANRPDRGPVVRRVRDGFRMLDV